MAWEQWVLVAVFTISSSVTILSIGEKRQPVSPVTATIAVGINCLLIYLITRL